MRLADGSATVRHVLAIRALLHGAAWIARTRVIWFHTLWIELDLKLPLEKAWLVRVGRQASCRCIEIFRVASADIHPPQYFSRGPAIKYNRWLVQPQGLPFGGASIRFGGETA